MSAASERGEFPAAAVKSKIFNEAEMKINSAVLTHWPGSRVSAG